MLFFHCRFRVYRIEEGCETLIAIKVVIVNMQQYLLKREYSKQVGNRQQGGCMSRTCTTISPLFLCFVVGIKVMIILQLQFVERLVHDGTLASPSKGLFNRAVITSQVVLSFRFNSYLLISK